MQVGKFWLITIDTIKGPWHVSSLYDGRGQQMTRGMFGENKGHAGSWYIVNKDTGKSKRIGPVKCGGKNWFDEAREEAKRRNVALGFEQDDGKKAHIDQVLSELGYPKIAEEAAAVTLFDRGIREVDMSLGQGGDYQDPFSWNVRMNLSAIERGTSNIKLDQIRLWIKRHHF